jgi:serine/threonine protein kinase/Tol biopolymer transport system component
MTLAAGTRLGHYDLVSALGAGGMGEVYRARDLRLSRDVAIKILPSAFTGDPDRLARFEREARILASLNHPNIAAIYGIEDAGGIRALVLELVEGETLADRIGAGAGKASAIPQREALEIARQIADALDAAHEKGIVHRDLKPGNVMITPNGAVKVLDFGLAKAADSGSSPDLTRSPTLTVEATRGGVLLGTAAYMSPEQARGYVVDKRTDIWAFGCLLYEMLAGRRTFVGETVTDTLAAVIEREPDWSALAPTTPPAVRRLLVRCLTRNPKRRLRDIGDAVLEIDGALQPAEPTASEHARSGRVPVWWVAAFAVCVLSSLFVGWMLRAPETASPDTIAGPMTRLTFDAGLTTEPSLSADGRLIAYASNRSGEGNLDIYVQQTTGGAAIRLTNDPADDHQPDVSPDGSVVAFRSERSPRGIYVASALGGNARLVIPDGTAPRFSPDGSSIAFWTGGWLAPRSVDSVRRTFVVPAAGGTPSPVAASLASVGDPIWAPDGKSLLVYARRATSGADTDPDWWWVPLQGGEPVATGAYGRFAARNLAVNVTDTHPYPQSWTSDGVVFAAADRVGDATGIWRIGIDQKSGRITSDPVQMTRGITTDSAPTAARDGRMAFAALTVTRRGFALPLDANSGKVTGPVRRVRDDDPFTGRTSLSENGRLQLVPKYEFASGGIWLRDMQSGRERQLAATPRTPLNPVISVDGRWAAYTVTAVDTGGNDGPGDGFVVDSNGGVPTKVCESCQIAAWTRDASQVVIKEGDQRELIRVDRMSGTRTPLITAARGPLDRPMFGPNGTWVTFNVNSGGRAIYVAPVHPDRSSSEAEWITILALSGGAERTAGLSPNGRLLYVLLERDGFRCLYALGLDPTTGRPTGEPFVVAHFHDASRRWGSTGLGSAVAESLFLADLFETTGNIWLTAPARTAAP